MLQETFEDDVLFFDMIATLGVCSLPMQNHTKIVGGT